tara:strand:- start:236 stop:415 length:180 start_codon:yes stop_codon:yes gene_type:complete
MDIKKNFYSLLANGSIKGVYLKLDQAFLKHDSEKGNKAKNNPLGLFDYVKKIKKASGRL